MAIRWLRALGFLLLALHLYSAVASPLHVVRRDDATPTITPAPSATSAAKTGAGEGETQTVTEKTDGTRSTQKQTGDPTSNIAVSTSTAFPSVLNGNGHGNDDSSESPNPVAAGELPLKPRLTPGWGIAGALLLISGIAYTLIGIKNAWLHTFLSAAFLSGLSVTVLIVYVMAPPISDAIQGGYVVAAIATGLVLGGAATLFREITEGLGCLLGGFCVSMWLLSLKPGGLLESTPSRAIFIGAFTAGCYGFYFSRYTRPYALMGLMSFAGATVIVLGIDSFSRAGLKEFWAYIWNLNNKGLFPYGTETYPLTKGIRVEIALTVVFTIVGIISQLKLWRVVQEHRAKKAEEQAEEQRKRDEEEANLGQQIEEQNARERQQWEMMYGNPPPRRSDGSGDSGLGGVEDEKKGHFSETIVQRPSSSEDEAKVTSCPTPADVATAESESESGPKAPGGMMTTEQDHGHGITIRVANDGGQGAPKELVSASGLGEKVWLVNADGEARPSSIVSAASTPAPPKPPGPEITPLPFTIPSDLDVDDDNHTSIAAYADEDDRSYTVSKKPSRLSMADRLSVSSVNILRNISRQSAYSDCSRRKSEFEMMQPRTKMGSTEELIENSKRFSDVQSIAATVDGLSYDGDDADWNLENENPQMSTLSIPALTVDLGGNLSDDIEPEASKEEGTSSQTHLKPPSRSDPNVRPTSVAETVGTDILDSVTPRSSSAGVSKPSSSEHGGATTDATNDSSKPTDATAAETTPMSSRPTASSVSSMTSTRITLTKDRLPSALPRVALSYRTNEWAKHLSAAEAPPLDQIRLDGHGEDNSKGEAEAAAPVVIEELQQTAQETTSPVTRPPSIVSNLPQSHSTPHRPTSRASSYSASPESYIPTTLAILTEGNHDGPARTSTDKNIPQSGPLAGHSFRGKGRRKSAEAHIQPIQEENGSEIASIAPPASLHEGGVSTAHSTPSSPTERTPVPGVVSYSSPQTLLGQREMLLRNRSQSQLFTSISPIPAQHPSRPASSQMDPPHDHYMAHTYMADDADDIPLSQRKALMRQSSMLSVNSNGARARRNVSTPVPHSSSANLISQTHLHPGAVTAESSHFDSHQPQRHSGLPSQAARDARLSNFRQSVAAELRAGTPVMPNSGRETPRHLMSTGPLLGPSPSSSNLEVDQTIEKQRSLLLSQREREAQKKEMERWGKVQNDRAFEEKMRRGDLVDAHREAMRRMQGGVKHK
ncbi:hypothetical protein GGS20DRAFT_255424 [Poronia punctata]|nr:hypothetical protein GGS20DRAFT_255424 [Poronia punctata]